MKKYKIANITNHKDEDDEEDELNNCIYSKNPNFIFISDMFPIIPKELFYPVISLSVEELNELVSNLITLDNLDIMEYLSNYSKPSKIELESTSISGCAISPIDNIEIPSLDDDKVLAQLEEENEKCLVLGRTFLKEAHKMFSSKFGLENVNIDEIPPEITEMSWKIPESVMLTIYKAFFEEIGFIESEIKTEKIITNNNKNEDLTLREIMEEEEAIARSIESEKMLIQNDQSLLLQMSSLEMNYTGISREELQLIFISNNKDIAATTSQLKSRGFESKIRNCNEIAERKGNFDNKPKKDYVADALKVQRLKERINQEENRIQHAQNKLNIIGRHDLHAQVAGYWKEEITQSKKRLVWYQEQIALASVAQQSLVYGNRQLDLHGFTQASAITALENRIELLKSSNLDINKGKHLMIICGRGLHSLNGRPRLKPAVRRYLISSKIDYSEPFDGTFQVSLQQFANRK